MDIIGLLVFAISIAFFGAYQTILFTNIRPEIDFPFRLRGGFRLGYVLDLVGDAFNLRTSSGKSASTYTIPSTSYTHTTTTNPHANAPTCPLKPTILVENLPLTNISASNISLITKKLRLAVERPMEAARRLANWTNEVWKLSTGALEWILSASPDLMLAFKLAVYLFVGCVAVILIGTTSNFLAAVNRESKVIGAEFMKNAAAGSNAISSVISQANAQQATFEDAMENLKSELNHLRDQMREKFLEDEEELTERVRETENRLRYANDRSRQIIEAVINSSRKIESGFLSSAAKEELFNRHIINTKEELKAAKNDVLANVMELRDWLTTFKRGYEHTIFELRDQTIRDYMEAFNIEKARLQNMISVARNTIDESSTKHGIETLAEKLRSQHSEIREQILVAQEDARTVGEKCKGVASCIPALKNIVEDMKDQLSMLAEDVAQVQGNLLGTRREFLASQHALLEADAARKSQCGDDESSVSRGRRSRRYDEYDLLESRDSGKGKTPAVAGPVSVGAWEMEHEEESPGFDTEESSSESAGLGQQAKRKCVKDDSLPIESDETAGDDDIQIIDINPGLQIKEAPIDDLRVTNDIPTTLPSRVE
ncbi:hypothetical protein LOZ51_002356 [Ophidiomyces ophidiicola]|nr:hypothetical protein LOZ55_000687 [Ophidiomyces ophidiicola]KAI1993223.1 hypothetical protein LOZ54_001425 [Ophidiomyces ophidiicola]KAI1998622.1 hypothetical protein LOZ51_002356 [Ophidiomyces ophidiicola]